MNSKGNCAIMICLVILNAPHLWGQADFSGTWILDHSRSDKEFSDYEITCIIGQTSQTFTVEQTLVMKNGEKTVLPPVTVKLDENEVVEEEKGGNDILSTNWSPDKKILTITFVRKMDGNKYGSKTSYNLSYNGQFLTIKSSDLAGESPMTQVYRKK